MTSVLITSDQVAAHQADVLLPPDAEFAGIYADHVEVGRWWARKHTVALVAICRNAMPFLPQTLKLVEQTGAMFREWTAFVYENDSTDGTKEILARWDDDQQRHVAMHDHGRPHLNNTIEPVRTHALAEYRAACQEFVRRSRHRPDYVIVFDTDAWGGWSVDGVATSMAWMLRDPSWYGLASYSWAGVNGGAIHYDAFAGRLNHWQRRDQTWWHHWHPPVGAPPVECRSAFGQLAVYRAQQWLDGTYSGEDCEHVCLHRSIAKKWTRKRFGLNPGSRCVSFWRPEETADGGRHVAD